jgi:hypothetical protein
MKKTNDASGLSIGSKRGTSTSLILMPLFDVKVLNEPAAVAPGALNRQALVLPGLTGIFKPREAVH